MPRNPYFDAYSEANQQELYRQLVDECVNFFGLQCTYIPRQTVAGVDLILGDDPTKYFEGAYPLQMYVENLEGFDGAGNLFSKFGLVINKQVKLLLSNTEFQVVTQGEVGVRPREGDLVWLPPFQALYEISFVEQDKFFYAFGRKQFYGFELTCEEFKYNNEDVITGNTDIDEIINTNIIAYQANVNTSGTLTYTLGETVYQGNSFANATATAVIISWNKPLGQLVLKDITGGFVANDTIIGVSSNAQYVLIDMDNMNDVNDPYNNAITIRDEANTDLDLTETNPSGNPVTYEGGEA